MPTIRIPPGVVRGETKAHIPQRWYETNLIRWQGGRMKPVGGWDRLLANPLMSIPRFSHVWFDTNGNKWRAYICDAHIYAQLDDTIYDLTPADFVDANSTAARGYSSGDYGELDYGMDDEDRGSGLGAADPDRPTRFSLDNWGHELVFASSADGRVFIWNPDTPATAPWVAEGVPPLMQAVIVTDEHHLMTFGGQGTRNRVAWSDQDNRIGWDFTRVDGQAGYFDLENAGRIYCGIKIPGAILAFTATGVWIGRYIGAPYFYGWNKLAEGCAPVSPHAIAVAGQRAWWMGTRSWWKFEGGIVAPMTSTLGIEPFETMFSEAAPRRVTAGFNGLYPEVWFFYPERESDESAVQAENNRYVIFNFEEGWWADGWMHRSFYAFSPHDREPVAGDDMGYVYSHEVGYLAEGQSREGMVYAQSSAISFDDGERNYSVHAAQIDSPLGPDSVGLTIEGCYNRGGQYYLHHENIRPRPDGWVDLHFQAKDWTLRINGIEDGPWALGAFNINPPKMRGRK